MKSLSVYIPYGENRNSEVLEYNKKVFKYFGISPCYIKFPFPAISHGMALDLIINDTNHEGYLFMENDSIPLCSDFMWKIYRKIDDGETLFGQAQNANHIKVNDSLFNVYAGPGCLAFSRKLWENVGKPSFDHNNRADCGGEFSWRVKEAGYNLCLVYPKEVYLKNCALENGLKFGMGNIYGNNMFYHAMQQLENKSSELFIEKCKEVLDGKYGSAAY